MANILMLDFCKANGIDPSGSYPKKAGRGFVYYLVRESTGSNIVSVIFHKSQAPRFAYSGDAKAPERKVFTGPALDKPWPPKSEAPKQEAVTV